MNEAGRSSFSLTGGVLILLIGVGIGLGAGHFWAKRQSSDSAASSNPQSARQRPRAPGHVSSQSQKDTDSQTESTGQSNFLGCDYVEEIFLKVQDGTWRGCGHAWREVMRDVTPDSIPTLLARAEALRDNEHRKSARDALLGRWAESDPFAALVVAGKIPNQRERDAAEQAIYSAWAEKDFDAALASINKLPEGKKRNELLESMTSAAGASNPEGAFAMLTSKKGSPSLRYRLSGICEQWARKNPQAAIQAMTGRSPAERREMAEGIARGWAENDSSAAMAWASSLAGFQDRKAAVSGVISSLDESKPGLR